MSDEKRTIGTKDSHPDRPARLSSHVLCEECFLGLDAKFQTLASHAEPSTKEGGK